MSRISYLSGQIPVADTLCVYLHICINPHTPGHAGNNRFSRTLGPGETCAPNKCLSSGIAQVRTDMGYLLNNYSRAKRNDLSILYICSGNVSEREKSVANLSLKHALKAWRLVQRGLSVWHNAISTWNFWIFESRLVGRFRCSLHRRKRNMKGF